MTPNPETPHIERTAFERKEPPTAITLWFCPACGVRITGSYSLDPARKRCSKKWHLTTAEGARYRYVERVD